MAKSEYTTRLITRIRPVTSRRLRLAAVVTGQHISELLDGVLTEHLPSAAELGQQVTNGSTADDHAN